MRKSPLMILVLLAACARPQPSPPNGPIAQKLAGTACTVPVHEADSLSWREVQGVGFGFCVPGEWEQSGNGSWRGDGGSIDWGLGSHRSTNITFAPAGTILGRSTTPMPPDVRRHVETIGGEEATITESRVGAAQLTSATWPKRKLWFEGKSGSSRDAERQLAVYRTVHFTPAPSTGTTTTPSP